MNTLENTLVVRYFPKAYYQDMTGESLRQRVKREMDNQSMSKAELSRRSGVPYHALDKFLKGSSLTTSVENGIALANALGFSVEDQNSYDELRAIFSQLSAEDQRFVLSSVRGLLKD